MLSDFPAGANSSLLLFPQPQRSLEDEVSRTTWEDLPIFAISYLVIFIYITVALGEYSSCRNILVGWKDRQATCEILLRVLVFHPPCGSDRREGWSQFVQGIARMTYSLSELPPDQGKMVGWLAEPGLAKTYLLREKQRGKFLIMSMAAHPGQSSQIQSQQ